MSEPPLKKGWRTRHYFFKKDHQNAQSILGFCHLDALYGVRAIAPSADDQRIHTVNMTS